MHVVVGGSVVTLTVGLIRLAEWLNMWPQANRSSQTRLRDMHMERA